MPIRSSEGPRHLSQYLSCGDGILGGQLFLSPTQLSSLTCPFLRHRFWFFKFLIFVGITVGAFYIPDGSFSNSRWPW